MVLFAIVEKCDENNAKVVEKREKKYTKVAEKRDFFIEKPLKNVAPCALERHQRKKHRLLPQITLLQEAMVYFTADSLGTNSRCTFLLFITYCQVVLLQIVQIYHL